MLAAASPWCKAVDQWGWRVREHLALLLGDVAVGDCLTSFVFAPVALGTSPACRDPWLAGGRLIALIGKLPGGP